MLKATIFTGFLIILSGFGGAALFATTTVIGTLLLCAIAAWQKTAVTIPEMQVGVVYRRGGAQYGRFLTAGSHLIKPFVEQLGAPIPLNPGSVNGRCDNTQTIGGLPLSIEWTVAYTLNPFRISPEKRPKLARTLPTKSGSIAVKHVNNILRHIVSEYTIDQLIEPGIQKRLERQIRQQVAERLSNAGFEISRVMIGAIEMPDEVRAALAMVHQRRLEAENEARTLEKLQQVVSRFSDADMQRLIELERIHALAQNGVTLMMPPGELFNGVGKRPYPS